MVGVPWEVGLVQSDISASIKPRDGAIARLCFPGSLPPVPLLRRRRARHRAPTRTSSSSLDFDVDLLTIAGHQDHP